MPQRNIDGMLERARYDGLKVLVVDDHVDQVDTLAVLLDLLGCQTATACDGRSALQLFHHVRPDVVFLDLDMPGLDGCDAALLLQAEDEAARTLLVCVTGRSEPADRERCLRAGFDLFFSKPMEEHQLCDALNAALEKKAWRPSANDPYTTCPAPLPWR